MYNYFVTVESLKSGYSLMLTGYTFGEILDKALRLEAKFKSLVSIRIKKTY